MDDAEKRPQAKRKSVRTIVHIQRFLSSLLLLSLATGVGRVRVRVILRPIPGIITPFQRPPPVLMLSHLISVRIGRSVVSSLANPLAGETDILLHFPVPKERIIVSMGVCV